MKKLLSLLASAALVATASSTVVACTWGCAAGNKKADPADKVAFTGDGIAKMEKPIATVQYKSDGKGFYEGYNGQTDIKISVDDEGHPVDTDGTLETNPGFGKRIVIGDDNKPVLDGKDKIYLDNSGYRIKYDSSTKTWYRVTSDGSHKLGPDGAPDSGSQAWAINSGSETDVADNTVPKNVDSGVAPYVTVDKNGKVTGYLNAKGQPVDATGKPISNTPAAYAPMYSESGLKGSDNVSKSYQREAEGKKWTLSGSIGIDMGKKAQDGSITVGDTKTTEGSIILNPSDSASHEYQTIEKGKYAGMQVRISADGKKVEFRWPTTNKQIGDIASGNTSDKESPLDKDTSGNVGIHLPLKFTDGKNGAGDVLPNSPKNVKVSTPWDANASSTTNGSSSTSGDASKVWWVGPSSDQIDLNYTEIGASEDVKVYVTDDLATYIRQQDHLDSADVTSSNAKTNSVSFQWDKNADNKDSYLFTDNDGSQYVKGHVIASSVDSFSSAQQVHVDFTKVFNNVNIKPLAGTNGYATVNLTAISRDIVFENNNESDITTDEKASFTIDKDKIASDIDYSNAIISFEDKDGKNNPAIKTATWDANAKTVNVEFNDGKLKFNDKAILHVKFLVKGTSGKNSIYGETDITAMKTVASVNESKLSFKEENKAAEFNGYTGTWTVDGNVGDYVDKTSVSVEVTTLGTGNESTVLKEVKTKATWDGTTLTVTLEDLGSNGPVGQYQVKASFNYTKESKFKDPINKQLTVERDNGKDINWTSGQTAFDFGQGNNVVATLDDSKIKDFDPASIDNVEVTSLSGLKDSEYTYSHTWDANTKSVTITLNNEIKKGNYDFAVILKDSKTGQALNPGIIKTVKDKPMSTEINVDWASKNQEFKEDGHSSVVYKVNSAGKDVDLSKAKVTIDDDTLKGALDKDPVWDSSQDTLTIKIKTDIPAKSDYKINVSFGYTNGYDGSTSDDLIANKDAPIDSAATVSFTTIDSSFDGDGKVEYDLKDHGSDVDLTSTPTVELTSGVVSKDAFEINWDGKKLIITLKGEIPGGENHLAVTFGLLNGYKGTTVPCDLLATKTVPNPDQTENVNWTSDTQVNAPLSDNDDATFTVDKEKTGLDIDLVNGPDVTLDTSKTVGNSPEFKKTWDADKGQLTIHFEKAVSHWKAVFNVTFKIGNGYTSDKAISAPSISVEKTKASAYEKEILVDKKDAGDVTYSKVQNTATWHVSTFGPAVDTSHYKVKITSENPKYKDQGPIDPRKAKVDNDGNVTNAKDAAKDVNKSGKFSISNLVKKENGESSGDITLAFQDGDLWEGKFDVEITFDLLEYSDQTSSTVLTFSKLEPDDAEKQLQADQSAGIKITGPHTVISWHGGVYSDATLVLDKFGVDVDYAHPQVQVKGSALTKGWIPDDYDGSVPVKYDASTGKTTLKLINWKILSAIGELIGSGKTFIISFALVGFDTTVSVELISK